MYSQPFQSTVSSMSFFKLKPKVIEKNKNDQIKQTLSEKNSYKNVFQSFVSNDWPLNLLICAIKYLSNISEKNYLLIA